MAFLARALMGGAVGLGKLTLGGGIRRTVTGAAAGGIYGMATSDANTPTGKFQDMLQGAFIGGGIGLGTTKLARQTLFGAARGLTGIGGGRGIAGPFRSPIARMAGGTARAGYGAARFAWRNPRTAATLGLAGVGMYGLAQSGPGTSALTGADTALTAQMGGISSTGFGPGMGTNTRQRARQMFIDSTHGLTQGLHHGRHR